MGKDEVEKDGMKGEGAGENRENLKMLKEFENVKNVEGEEECAGESMVLVDVVFNYRIFSADSEHTD